jgi:hypothetical protein
VTGSECLIFWFGVRENSFPAKAQRRKAKPNFEDLNFQPVTFFGFLCAFAPLRETTPVLFPSEQLHQDEA